MAGLNLDRIAVRLICGRTDLDVARNALAERGFPPRGPRSWVKDRIALLSTVAAAPTRYPGIGPVPSGAVAYDPASREPRLREYRRFFVEHYFDEQISFLGRRETPRGDTKQARARSARWYWFGVLLGLLGFLDWSSRRYNWLAASLNDFRAYARALDDIDRVYVFSMHDRRSYLLAGFLHRHSAVEVVPVYRNKPLYGDCRFQHLRIPVVLTSKVNLHEAEYFRAGGSFLASELVYLPQEFLLDTIDLAPTEPVTDIGYFSGGEWALRDGLHPVHDPEIVRSGVLRGSPDDVQADEIVRALADYAKRTRHTLVIFPHPLEHELMHESGVTPPYADLADGRWVRIDDADDVGSRNRVYGCKIAVSLQPAIIWERLDLGLEESFVFEWADQSKNAFLREALGPDSGMLFRTTDELLAKLNAAFSSKDLRGSS